MTGRSYLIFGIRFKVGPKPGERSQGREPSGPTTSSPAPLPQWAARQDFVDTLPSAAYILAGRAELELTDSA